MKNDSFTQMDESWMKETKKLREHKIPESAFRGFSESVEKEILKSKGASHAFGAGTFLLSVSLVFAVGLLIWQWPNLTHQPNTGQKFVMNKSVSLESAINADVQALKALGEWSEEDEIALGIPVENAFADFAEFDLDVDDDGIMIGRNVGISIY